MAHSSQLHCRRITGPVHCGSHLLGVIRASFGAPAAMLAMLASYAHAATIDWIGPAQSVNYPVVVSGNGAVVAYTSSSNALMLWTPGGGAVPLGGTGVTHGLTHDGSVAVGQANGSPPGYFFAFASSGGSIVALPLDSPTATFGQWASGISADGQRVCGNEFLAGTTARACEWDFGSPTTPPDTPQGYLLGGPAYLTSAISRDGSVIVGSSSVTETQGATVWNRTATHMPIGRHDLALLAGGNSLDVARAASGNGSIVLGSLGSGTSETGWYWTWAAGTARMASITDVGVSPTALDAAASRIVGNGNSSTLPMFYRAVIWEGLSATPRLLQDVVELDHGLSLGGAILMSATGISADGTTITGLGFRPGSSFWEAYRLTLGATTGVVGGGVRDPSLAVQPNPARGMAWAEWRTLTEGPATLEIVDVAGRVHLSRPVTSTGRAAVREGIDLTGLPEGAYWVRLREGTSSRSVPLRVLR